MMTDVQKKQDVKVGQVPTVIETPLLRAALDDHGVIRVVFRGSPTRVNLLVMSPRGFVMGGTVEVPSEVDVLTAFCVCGDCRVVHLMVDGGAVDDVGIFEILGRLVEAGFDRVGMAEMMVESARRWRG